MVRNFLLQSEIKSEFSDNVIIKIIVIVGSYLWNMGLNDLAVPDPEFILNVSKINISLFSVGIYGIFLTQFNSPLWLTNSCQYKFMSINVEWFNDLISKYPAPNRYQLGIHLMWYRYKRNKICFIIFISCNFFALINTLLYNKYVEYVTKIIISKEQ